MWSVFILHTNRMSAKKSPSNIRRQDHDEFKRKLQAVHQEMATSLFDGTFPFPNPQFLLHLAEEIHTMFRGPRLKKEFLCRSVRPDGTETYIGGLHPDSTQTIIFWDQEKPRRRWEQVWGPGARKWIQEYYTDDENRTIGEIIA